MSFLHDSTAIKESFITIWCIWYKWNVPLLYYLLRTEIFLVHGSFFFILCMNYWLKSNKICILVWCLRWDDRVICSWFQWTCYRCWRWTSPLPSQQPPCSLLSWLLLVRLRPVYNHHCVMHCIYHCCIQKSGSRQTLAYRTIESAVKAIVHRWALEGACTAKLAFGVPGYQHW